jgi:predicted NAD/FAD-dependent oxidoreductase
MTIKQVAIVGAGLAGLTCARELTQAGLAVTVFEKSRGVGGRLSTRRVDWATFDHGTQYFTARDPVFTDWVNGLIAQGTVSQWSPVMSKSNPAEPWYVANPGMNSLARAQAKDLNVVLNTRVSAIKWQDGQWHLVFEEGAAATGGDNTNETTFDAVVLAVPNEQADPLLQPHRADWAASLAAIPLLPCWTVMLSTEPVATTLQAGQPDSGPIGWWARNDSKPERSNNERQQDWVIQASSTWTEQNLNADKTVVIDALQKALLAQLGVEQMVSTQTAMAHRWLYARRTPGLATLGSSLWHAQQRLGVCGDGLTHSRVEQAYLSGRDVARSIVNESPS